METSQEVEILSRATAATTKLIKVKLDKIRFDLDRYCHRDQEALSEENLASLMDSLILEGLQVPLEVSEGEDGMYDLIKGYRRTAGCRVLADKNTEGFTRDMDVDAILVKGTLMEKLLRSILDNEVRLNLDRIARIRAAKKLYDAKVPDSRAARALGISEKSYQRDLLIARNPWAFQHVIDGSIAPTHATLLLEAAAERMSELREDLDAWIASKKREIREKDRLRRVKGEKELRPTDKLVKNQMPNHLVAHWVELLRAEKGFDEDAEWNYAAGFEMETKQLHIPAISLNLAKAPLEQVGKVVARLSRLTQQLKPVIQERVQMESRKTAAGIVVDPPYDTDCLRELGLVDFADELDKQMQDALAPDGEESDREQVQERKEVDLAAEVELPEAKSKVTAKDKANDERRKA